MPYVGETFSMVILLPDRGAGLKRFEKGLTRENLDAWLSGIKASNMDLVAIPRFKMTLQYDLSTPLAEMGMKTALTRGADFSGMTGGKDLFLSKVVHKSFVEVNEEGTEAAAATGGVMRVTSVQQPRIFRADHPFLFLIRDRTTGAVIFMGRVVNPQ
jgi:serpin B